MGVSVPFEKVEQYAYLVGCKADKFPSTYLGLPIGQNMSRLIGWKEINEKFTKNFLTRKYLCFLLEGGRCF